MVFYRGFRACRPGEKGADGNYDNPNNDLTLEQARARCKDGFVGVLNPGIVLVDVDTKEEGLKLWELVRGEGIKCRVLKTTKGYHFLFRDTRGVIKKNANKCMLALGIEADFKIGNAKGLENLKFGGVERELLQECNNPDELPKFLYPIGGTNPGFCGLAEGGRNNKLFAYAIRLTQAGFTKKQSRDVMKLINAYMFKEPLDDYEMSMVTRDEAFEKIKAKTEKFEHWTFGDELIDCRHICRINNVIHVYDEESGVYLPANGGWLETAIIRHDKTLVAAKRSEVVKYINYTVNHNSVAADARYIAFRNGVYDIVNDEVLEFSPDIRITNKINYDYISGAYSELCDNVLNKLANGDAGIRALLEEIIGYCFYRRNELRKAFVLKGDKANGKSTYLDMIRTLLGDDNKSSLDLQDLGDRFKTAQLCGKLANIGDDIGDMYIPNPSIFKKLTSGDGLTVEEKGERAFDMVSYAKLLFSANTVPRMKDKSGAVQDRLIIVPFKATFSRNDPDYDPYIKYKLRDKSVMEYLIQIGVKGLKRVLENDGFTMSNTVVEENKRYEEENHPELLFFEELDLELDVLNQPTKDVYMRYTIFCSENNYQPIGYNNFSKRLVSCFPGVKSAKRRINGKQVYIFVG